MKPIADADATLPFSRADILLRGLSVVLGLVFLVSSIGKMFSLDAFAGTIQSITSLSAEAAFVLAVLTITIELIGSFALIARYKVNVVAMLFCIVTAIFIAILLVAVSRGKEINCNCFGIFNVGLSNRSELLLDLVLFNSFLLLAFASRRRQSVPDIPKLRRALRIAGSIVVMFYLEFAVVKSVFGLPLNEPVVDVSPAARFAENHNSSFASARAERRLIFLLQYSDFNCPMCFEDFRALCDAVAAESTLVHPNRVLAIFKSDELPLPQSQNRLSRWAKANNITVPLLVSSDSLFNVMKVSKSMAAIIDGADKVLLAEQFPMGSSNRSLAIQLLTENVR